MSTRKQREKRRLEKVAFMEELHRRRVESENGLVKEEKTEMKKTSTTKKKPSTSGKKTTTKKKAKGC